jgi:hypothetical protein
MALQTQRSCDQMGIPYGAKPANTMLSTRPIGTICESDVAYLRGFKSSSDSNVAFKRAYGVFPREAKHSENDAFASMHYGATMRPSRKP